MFVARSYRSWILDRMFVARSYRSWILDRMFVARLIDLGSWMECLLLDPVDLGSGANQLS